MSSVLGRRLRLLRESKNIAQKDLADILHISNSTLSQYESGQRVPSDDVKLQFASYFGVTVDYLLGRTDNKSTHTGTMSREDILSIPGIEPLPHFTRKPRLGAIACGEPIIAIEDADEFDDVPEEIACDFTLLCRGDSMIGARIYDGDIVYIRSQDTVESGEIAAVMIDDEATLKRVRIYPDQIVLFPENPQYEPLVFSKEEMNNVRILGKAVAFTSRIR